MPASTQPSAAPAPGRPPDARPELSTRNLLERLGGIAWAYRGGVVRVLLLQMILQALLIAGVGQLGLGVDVIVYGFDPERHVDKQPQYPLGVTPPAEWSAQQQAVAVAGVILAIGLLRFVLEYAALIERARLVERIVVSLRSKVFAKLQRLSFRFFDANASGSIINRVTGDVQAVRMFVSNVVIEVVVIVLSLAFYVAYLVSIDAGLAAACLATTPVLWFLTTSFGRRVKPMYRKSRELFDDTVRVLSENVQGVRVVKGFARQPREQAKFDASNQRFVDHNRTIHNKVAWFLPTVGLVSQFNLTMLIVFGAWAYARRPEFTTGQLLAFSLLLQHFAQQVGNVSMLANALQRSLIGAQRVFEVLDEPVDIASPAEPVRPERLEGRIAFEDVGFSSRGAGGAPALERAGFEANPGQVVALLGATGAGKSSLLSLIPRFYDPTQGRVTIDGVDAKDLDLEQLRRSVGLVFQESFLFSNTVAANIAFGRPEATMDQVRRAAEIARADGFIQNDLAHGYDTVLAEGGSDLSGGQRQRLAIARAILLDPPILVMDDPTAAIDPETEHEILSAMDQAMQGRTTFLVAHRMSTLRRADLVLVLDRGRIVERGDHDQLMAKPGLYRAAALAQSADDASRKLLGLDADDAPPADPNARSGEDWP
ncbi:MAG: ABC transporter ATP-binding protein [Planctomycetota bacterium]